MFFIINGILIGNVFVDSVAFNGVFILINGFFSILILIQRYYKVKLDPIEERIYQKDFKRVMDRTTFKNLIRKAYLRSYSDGGQIVYNGNNFSSLYYVALLNPAYKISYLKGGVAFTNVEERTWTGVIEYVTHERNKKKAKKLQNNFRELERLNKEEKVKYSLTAVVLKKTDEEMKDVPKVDKIYEEYDEPCYVYEFSLRVKRLSNLGS
jgi:hypothetical protein